MAFEWTQRDGWHVITSSELPGLLVAHKDPETAFKDVPKAIEMLLALDAQGGE